MTRQKLDQHGRPLPDDDDIIPDGGRVRVALPFMDHLTLEMRRALGLIKDDGKDEQGFIRGHRPGAMVRVVDETPRDNYIRHLNDAWKHPPTEVKAKQPATRSDNNDGAAAHARMVQRISNAWRTAT